MNVLLFVTCFLMLLSMLTYAKIDNFRYFLGTQAQFESYMHKLEHAYSDQAAVRWYETTIANKQAPSDNAKNAPHGSSSRRLSFKILIDAEMQSKHPVAHEQTLAWAKALIQNLYGRYGFYQEVLKKRPSFADELLERLKQAVIELPIEMRPKDASELANLVLGDEFDEIFYLMLKGSPTAKESKLKVTPLNKEETPEDEQDIAQAALEAPVVEGYDSLLNYITLQNTHKIRVFLAPKEVLQAVFSQTEIAQSVMQTRYQLYQSLVQGDTVEHVSDQLKANFDVYMHGNAAELLDFRVSKTNPLRYN